VAGRPRLGARAGAHRLDAFVTRRLLATDTDNDTVLVGVAHEAFLSAWPPLSKAISAAASALRMRRVVEQAAAEWEQSNRPPERLWERGQLASAVAETGARIRAASRFGGQELAGSGPAPSSRRRSPTWLSRPDQMLDVGHATRPTKPYGLVEPTSAQPRGYSALVVWLPIDLVYDNLNT
jgi:hypothetical protein